MNYSLSLCSNQYKKKEMKFTTLLRRVILEEKSKFEILFDKLTNPTVDKQGKTRKPQLTKEEFFELMSADPTTKLNNVDLATASPDIRWTQVTGGAIVQQKVYTTDPRLLKIVVKYKKV